MFVNSYFYDGKSSSLEFRAGCSMSGIPARDVDGTGSLVDAAVSSGAGESSSAADTAS